MPPKSPKTTGTRVAFKAGKQETAGYLALPRSGTGPGVIVFQEWWGLVPHIEKTCDRLAEQGFAALAPDMYSGRSTTNPDEAGRLMMALEVPKVAEDVAGALEFLRTHKGCSSARVGVTGFCLGGQLALWSACKYPAAVAACVDFYGVHPNLKPDLKRLRAPVLGIFAEKDAYVNAQVVADLSAALAAAGKHHDFKTYEGVNHAFMNDTRKDVYDKTAAADAWSRTVEFLRAHVN
ncbi:MAG: Carboxymethylenebutenolidase [Planctomycetes bacterium]|nr:Carboxymethylenebutenolidase [Planctomycetota bacterium]